MYIYISDVVVRSLRLDGALKLVYVQILTCLSMYGHVNTYRYIFITPKYVHICLNMHVYNTHLCLHMQVMLSFGRYS
jgi:hypothetical protein